MGAKSFFIELNRQSGGADASRVDWSLREAFVAASAHGTVRGGLVFASGGASREAPRLAEIVRRAWPNVPACVVPAAGVLTERGEVEGGDAVSGLVFCEGRAAPFAAGEREDAGAAIAKAAGDARAVAIVFARSLDDRELDPFARREPKVTVIGAGTAAAPIAITANGELSRGRVAGLVLTRVAPPLSFASPACKLLDELAPITGVEDGLVLRIGDRTAIEALSHATSRLTREHQRAEPLLFAAIGEDDSESDETKFFVRPVRGLDPDRGGVLVGPDAALGARVAFGVRDPAAAREDFESAARSLKERAAGSVPSFAIALSCAGRGAGLYGAPEVESRILRQRLGDVPFAGMHSAFEIAELVASRPPRVLMYTTVVALFRSPS